MRRAQADLPFGFDRADARDFSELALRSRIDHTCEEANTGKHLDICQADTLTLGFDCIEICRAVHSDDDRNAY
jgi:hypothetical protein